MKVILKNILFYILNPIFHLRFKSKIRKVEKLLLVDIDNTIAKTHEYLIEKHKIEVSELEPIVPVQKWIMKQAKDKTVIYLSARNYLLYGKTRKWLKDKGFIFEQNMVVLVLTPLQKIQYLETCLKDNVQVTYIDDMSFVNKNHEHHLYEDLIRKIEKMPIEYLGYKEIKKLILAND